MKGGEREELEKRIKELECRDKEGEKEKGGAREKEEEIEEKVRGMERRMELKEDEGKGRKKEEYNR